MIRTYANTKAELNIAEERLNYLMQKKEELYTKFFPLSSNTSGVGSGHTNLINDKMADYVAELTKVNPITNMSLDAEIQEQRNKVTTLEYYIKRMKKNLEETTGIENELFTLIVVKGVKITRAVDIIAAKYKKDTSTIWKYHYAKIQKEISICLVNVQ